MAKLREKVLGSNPYCVYCGGATSATQVDHFPPIAVFQDRRRPAGGEVSVCDDCHRGTRNSDQVAATLSRITVNTEHPSLALEAESHLSNLAKYQPDLFREFYIEDDCAKQDFILKNGKWERVHYFRANGPRLTEALVNFGARMGLALHYLESGRIVPDSGGVFVRWYSNYDEFMGRIPQFSVFTASDVRTLSQGKKFEVSQQFIFTSKVVEEKTASLHISAFRDAFYVVAFVFEDVLNRKRQEAEFVRPGFLKNGLI